MCDIYDHPCKVCGLKINMHLANYATAQTEIEVFCRKHIPKNPKVKIYNITSKLDRMELGTTRVGVLALTENAENHSEGNHPNCAHFEEIIANKKKKGREG